MAKMKINDGILVSYQDAHGDIIIPGGITSIGSYAFWGCEGLTSISIPDSVKSIGGCAFYGCTSLTEVIIPDSVTSIGSCAFWGCISLTEVIIPDSVTSIGSCAFWECIRMTSQKGNYKAFNLKEGKLFCRNYEYTQGEWSKEITEPVLCKKGYHFCTNLFSIFNYYYGEIDKDIAIYECEVGDKVFTDEDKSVTNRIKPVRRLNRKEIFELMKG